MYMMNDCALCVWESGCTSACWATDGSPPPQAHKCPANANVCECVVSGFLCAREENGRLQFCWCLQNATTHFVSLCCSQCVTCFSFPPLVVLQAICPLFLPVHKYTTVLAEWPVGQLIHYYSGNIASKGNQFIHPPPQKKVYSFQVSLKKPLLARFIPRLPLLLVFGSMLC